MTQEYIDYAEYDPERDLEMEDYEDIYEKEQIEIERVERGFQK